MNFTQAASVIDQISYELELSNKLAAAETAYRQADEQFQANCKAGKYPRKPIAGSTQAMLDQREVCRLGAKVYEVKNLIADQRAVA